MCEMWERVNTVLGEHNRGIVTTGKSNRIIILFVSVAICRVELLSFCNFFGVMVVSQWDARSKMQHIWRSSKNKKISGIPLLAA